MPVALSQMRVSRKITVNLDQSQLNVRPIIKGKTINIMHLIKSIIY